MTSLSTATVLPFRRRAAHRRGVAPRVLVVVALLLAVLIVEAVIIAMASPDLGFLYTTTT